jgi:hypothetical protein
MVEQPGLQDQPHQPKTFAERLDAAQSGDEFGDVLSGLFKALETARDADG